MKECNLLESNTATAFPFRVLFSPSILSCLIHIR
jgi:hypothetical protein